jgi:hypothetical protein
MFDANYMNYIILSCLYLGNISRECKMKAIRPIAVCLLFVVSLYLAAVSRADMADIAVYKGELRIIVPDKQTRDSLVIRYRSKTREVVRITLEDLSLTNLKTQRLIRLADKSASLENIVDQGGYWNTDVSYSGLNLGQGDYRVDGRLTLHLIGSQRTSDFNAYLQPRVGSRPIGSSIDWGVSDESQ